MNVLEQLLKDHENIATLLDILEDQLDRIREMEKADYDLVRDIMHYMTTYPDSFHHPMEDLVVEKLIERDPSYREIALSLVKDHAELARKSSAFLEMLVKLIDGEIVLRKDIVARGVEYIRFLRSHMRQEDERLFPLAKAMLSDQDWNHISEIIEHRRDPVFGEIVEAQYRSIYEFISLQSES
jgi:hemerythrin-like domain-containing protein